MPYRNTAEYGMASQALGSGIRSMLKVGGTDLVGCVHPDVL